MIKAKFHTLNARVFDTRKEAEDYQDLCFNKWFREHPQIDIRKLYLNADDNNCYEEYTTDKGFARNIAREYWERYVVE